MKKLFLAAAAGAAMLIATMAGASAASLVAHIDVSSQTMTVSKNGFPVHHWKVSTARKGYSTPRGTYRPQRMARMWYSRKYDNSPMPHSVFFRGGYAIHGTNHLKALGRPASHGCVRLHPSNAAELFSMIKQVGSGNTRIVITN
ncbi:MAG: L,D-transpeptidase [Phyllobacteriaceae bacterium]|nr:L,D-transpeptidase [Phyllobacteriaceae bacterium]